MGSLSTLLTARAPIGATGVTGATGIQISNVAKNRIINGSMVIDQRNAGASVTPTGTSYVSCDRWYPQLGQSSKFSVQQQTAVVPSDFYYAQKFAVVSTVSIAAGDYFGTEQRLEGYNVNDFNYGTANAKDTTLSFWAYANNAGTYCGSIYNPTGSGRSFVYNYTLTANTWTKITVNIAGDTTTVLGSLTNGQALSVRFALSVGSNYQIATTNSWTTGNYTATSSAFNWIGTSGATLYITGVQLEVGSTATSFEYRQYSQELALCQRYCYATPYFNLCFVAQGAINSAGFGLAGETLPVTMRTTPTATLAAASNYTIYLTNGGTTATVTGIALNGVTNSSYYLFSLTWASGGSNGQSLWLAAVGAPIILSAEL